MTQDQRAQRADQWGIFPTFFMAGFECSTFLWKDGERKDYVKITGHEEHLEDDYRRLHELGIDVVREAVRWPFVDKGHGRYDFSFLERVTDALERYRLTAIWDLCHYGLPDNCDPFSDDCIKRFEDYCLAVTEFLAPRTDKSRSVPGPELFTPVNEISFFSGAGTDMGWMYPFAKGRYHEFKRALVRMDIAGANAIRSVEPDARMVHVDPIIHHVPPDGRPDLEDEAKHKAYEEAYEAWDMLYGKKEPELGGSPEILDIVGVNIYHFSQAIMKEDGEREVLGPQDPRRRSLGQLLLYAWERYKRPIIIGETSGYQDKRGEWLRMTMEESLKALNSGVDLQGVCLYPCVDIPDWNTGEMAKIGIFDIEDVDSVERIPCDAYIAELRHWQHELHQPEQVSVEAIERHEVGRVDLEEVKRYAREWEERMPGPQTVEPLEAELSTGKLRPDGAEGEQAKDRAA